jgi:hypothetical protein
MATRKPEPSLTRAELRLWWQAYLAGGGAQLLKGGTRRNPAGSAHLAAEFADASIIEYQRRKIGGPS